MINFFDPVSARFSKYIEIYTNNLDDKYKWLKNKFKDDVFICINEINFDKINKEYINLIIFDDLVFSNKKITEFYCRSSCIVRVFLLVIAILKTLIEL